MNKEALERIKGYCCEVTQHQWDELVKAADEAGVDVGENVRGWKFESVPVVAAIRNEGSYISLFSPALNLTLIPFPAFLSKLKGEEEWKPKAGEVVEVSNNGVGWIEREFIATRAGKHFCWNKEGDDIWPWDEIRPIRPTIKRAEAEALLNKRIID